MRVEPLTMHFNAFAAGQTVFMIASSNQSRVSRGDAGGLDP